LNYFSLGHNKGVYINNILKMFKLYKFTFKLSVNVEKISTRSEENKNPLANGEYVSWW
jgi:hypothetical protein